MGLESHRRKVSAQKQAAILRAAQENFLKNGYSRAGMADIARDADVSTATLYKHFASKEALFTAVVKSIARSTGEDFNTISPQETARDVLHKVARDYLSVQYDRNANALMRIVIAEVPGAPTLAGEVYDVLGNRKNASLKVVLDELVAAGKLRPHDTGFGARLGAGMLKEVFVWPALFDAGCQLPPDTDEKIYRVVDAYLALFGPGKES